MSLSKKIWLGLGFGFIALGVFCVARNTCNYGPVEIGAQVEVTHGFYTNCTGEVVAQDEHGCFWIEAMCDGEDRGKLMFTKDFLRRTQ